MKGSSEGEEEVRTAVKGIEVRILSPRLWEDWSKTSAPELTRRRMYEETRLT